MIQVDPDVMIRRIQGRLSLEEVAACDLPAESVAHNLWDGVGIGLKRLGRLEKR